MTQNKTEIASVLVSTGALKFGTFKLLSGRESPYFFDIGAVNSGDAVARVATLYAGLIKDVFGSEFHIVFGPSYKGIPLCVSTVVALSRDFGISSNYLFNRKVAKDHAEGGMFVGSLPEPNRNRIVIVDDVFTTGKTKYDMVDLLRKTFPSASILGVIIALDRQEKSETGRDAIQEFTETTGIPVHPLLSIGDILEYLKDRHPAEYDAVRSYVNAQRGT
jgi:orotate phosphoribosyltransferase